MRKEMPDKGYLLYLREKQQEMKGEILKSCITKRNGGLIEESILYEEIKKRYQAHWDETDGDDAILKGIFRNQIAFLERQGDLISKKTENGIVYWGGKQTEQLEQTF